MVKIENLDEFNRIKDSKFGYVVFSSKDYSIIHKPECNDFSTDDFIDAKPENEKSFHWFSTLALVEKEFPQCTSCKFCNPD